MPEHKKCSSASTTTITDTDDGPFFELNLAAPQQNTRPKSLCKTAKFRLFLISKLNKKKPKLKFNQVETEKENTKQDKKVSKLKRERTLLELLSDERPFSGDMDKKTKTSKPQKLRKWQEKRPSMVAPMGGTDEVKHQQDGIQSAILYCKKSFNESTTR